MFPHNNPQSYKDQWNMCALDHHEITCSLDVRETFYPNLMRRWRNAVLNLRMTCRIAQSNKMAVRIQLPKQIGGAGYRPSHASRMPLVFEGCPRLLSLQPQTIRVKEQEHTPQKTPNLQLPCLGSYQYLISRWPFVTTGEFRRKYLNSNSTEAAADTNYRVFSM